MAKMPSLSKQAAAKSGSVVSRAGGGKGSTGGAPPAIKSNPAPRAVNGGTSKAAYRGKPKSGQINGMC